MKLDPPDRKGHDRLRRALPPQSRALDLKRWSWEKDCEPGEKDSDVTIGRTMAAKRAIIASVGLNDRIPL
jgi:hypothetical protein